MITIVIFFPETNRSIVGDGSIPPPIWNRSLFQLFREDDLVPNRQSLEKKVTGINPLISLRILANKENFIVCVYGSFLFAGFSSLTSVLASQLQERYHYNEVQVGLCYLPIGIGSIFSRWTTAKLIDRNFRRQAEKQGVSKPALHVHTKVHCLPIPLPSLLTNPHRHFPRQEPQTRHKRTQHRTRPPRHRLPLNPRHLRPRPRLRLSHATPHPHRRRAHRALPPL